MKLSRREIKSFSDADIISSYKEKSDPEIIGELYLRYGHLMMGTCLNYLKDKQNAEDTVMEIFMDLDKKIKQHEIKYFKSWLFMVTKNACLMKLRKKKHLNVQIKEELIADEDEIHIKQMKEVKITALENAIEELDPPQDDVIKLFYIQKMTYKDISDQLNLTMKKVKSAIQNGKRNLKIKLKENDLFKSA